MSKGFWTPGLILTWGFSVKNLGFWKFSQKRQGNGPHHLSMMVYLGKILIWY